MHITAYEIAQLFFQTYVRAGNLILDVGSMDINGSLRVLRPMGDNYIGVDLEAGKGVDVVVESSAKLPFVGEVFDIVVSTSCFEHDLMFWNTFLEMCRVLKDGGYLYLNAPSKGAYHQHPIDAWRFFPDAGIALRDWAQLNKQDIQLLESFVTENSSASRFLTRKLRLKSDIISRARAVFTSEFSWNDCVMIFGKKAESAAVSVSERYDLAMNIRRWPNLSELQKRRGWW